MDAKVLAALTTGALAEPSPVGEIALGSLLAAVEVYNRRKQLADILGEVARRTSAVNPFMTNILNMVQFPGGRHIESPKELTTEEKKSFQLEQMLYTPSFLETVTKPEILPFGNIRLPQKTEYPLDSFPQMPVLPGMAQDRFNLSPVLMQGEQSRIAGLIGSNPQGAWTPEQLSGFLKGKVNQNEMETLLTPDVMGKPKITKEEILGAVEKNMPQVDLVKKGGKRPDSEIQRLKKRQDNLFKEWEEYQTEAIQTYGRNSNIWPNEVRRQNQAIQDSIKATENQINAVDKSTKFSQWQLPGGENYQETLIKTPTQYKTHTELPSGYRVGKMAVGERYSVWDNEGNVITSHADTVERAKKSAIDILNEREFLDSTKTGFKSSHWDEPNVLAHVRHNDRVTPKGEKVRFLEEIQSDWATTGRKEGFKTSESNIEWAERMRKEQGNLFATEKEMELMRNDSNFLVDIRTARDKGTIPSHPLLKSWQELSLKQALKDAVDSDADYLSWTTGEQQARRYDLSKQVDKLTYEKMSDGQYQIYGFKGGDVQIEQKVPENKLDTLVGKEIAQRIKDGKGKKAYPESKRRDAMELTGVDLKIGGEWAKNLYDKQIPNILKKLTGQDVEIIDLPDMVDNPKYETGESEIPMIWSQQPAIRLTPELKNQIKSKKGKVWELFGKLEKPEFGKLKPKFV